MNSSPHRKAKGVYAVNGDTTSLLVLLIGTQEGGESLALATMIRYDVSSHTFLPIVFTQ